MTASIKLVSGTDVKTGKTQTFEVGINVAKLSSTVETAIKKDDDDDNDDEEYMIPQDGVDLPKVSPHVLKKVISFCEYYVTDPMNEIPKPLKKELKEYVQEWYAQFLDSMDEDALADVIMAANYMDVRPLLNLTCAKVAIIIRDMSPEEIREKYNIKNDFTPEEEEKLRQENKWRNHKK